MLSVESLLEAGAAAKGQACSIENFCPPTHVFRTLPGGSLPAHSATAHQQPISITTAIVRRGTRRRRAQPSVYDSQNPEASKCSAMSTGYDAGGPGKTRGTCAAQVPCSGLRSLRLSVGWHPTQTWPPMGSFSTASTSDQCSYF